METGTDSVARRLRGAADALGTGEARLPFSVNDVVAAGDRRRRRAERRRSRAATVAVLVAILAAIVVPLPTFHLLPGRHRAQHGGGARPAGTEAQMAHGGRWSIRNYPGTLYGFRRPAGIILEDSVAFVASVGKITEIDASNGTVVRRIDRPESVLRWSGTFAVAGRVVFVPSGPDSVSKFSVATGRPLGRVRGAYRFSQPTDGVYDGSNVFFANQANDTVTEINARSGALVRVLDALRYEFNDPASLVLSGEDLWVADAGLPGATEIDARSGALVRVLDAARFGFDAPFSVAAIDGRVWLANYYEGNSLTEVSARTGALIRLVRAAGTPIDIPFQLAAGDGALWVTVNRGLAELDPESGAIERVFSRPYEAFSSTYQVAAGEGHVWVTNAGSVTELTFVAGKS